VTTVGSNAFQNCTGLKDVTVQWQTPPAIDYSVFQNVNVSAVTLHVPSGRAGAYRAANFWKEFSIDDGSVSYHPDDVAFLRHFLNSDKHYQHFGLNSNYESLPDWIEKVNGITWSSRSPKRITGISWNSHSLVGHLDVSALTELVELNIANNLLILTAWGLPSLERIDCSHDGLFSLDIGDNPRLQYLDCRENILSYNNLPALNIQTYNYAPQVGFIFTAKPGSDVDLTDYLRNGRTVFRWYLDNSTTPLSDVYQKSSGVFYIPASYSGLRLACKITNSDFPGFDSKPVVCRVDVTVAPAIKAEQTAGKGSIDVKVPRPSNAQRMKGSLRIVSDGNITVDTEKTMEEYMKQYNDYMGKIEKTGDKFSWWNDLGPATRAQTDGEMTVITIYYNINKSLADGAYTLKLADLRFDFDEGTSYRESELPVPVTADPVDNETVVSPLTVTCYNRILTVTSPSDEQVAIYSVSGTLLYKIRKTSGTAICRIGHLPRGVLIVRGSSGWDRKILLE
jgi:hypothetical protein